MKYDQQIIDRKPSELTLLAENPRQIKPKDFQRLVDSIKINGFWRHRPLAIEERDGKLVVLAGNQRLKAAKKLKLETVPTILYSEMTEEDRADLVLRDNVNNGDWDGNKLQVEDMFQGVDFEFVGLGDILRQQEDEEASKAAKGKKAKAGDDNEDCTSEEGEEKESFYRSMYRDVLYPSNNDYDIPTLDINMQAGKLELPLSPWGANSRLRKDVTTYHFYVDDYRFEHLFKDPVKLLMSECRAIVEPNCSCHDQTPIAWGIQLIYKKRFLARYFQECGIQVYADLNVSHKFVEYNKMGIPKGWNAFFTRGLDEWIESLKSDLQVAQEISGLEVPNLIVYGGGKKVQKFCQEHNLLYVTDFINAKKMGCGSGGVTGTKRGSNKATPTQMKAAITSSEKAMHAAAYGSGTNAEKQAAIDKAATQVTKAASAMPIENVEAWHK